MVARLRDVVALFLLDRQRVEAGGLLVGGRDQGLRHTVAGDVEESRSPAGLADRVVKRAAGGALSLVECARVNDRDHAPARRNISAKAG